jgi:hypothetical protein
MIRFPCPICSNKLKAPDQKAGARTRCPGCYSPVQVPVLKDWIATLPAPPYSAGVADDYPPPSKGIGKMLVTALASTVLLSGCLLLWLYRSVDHNNNTVTAHSLSDKAARPGAAIWPCPPATITTPAPWPNNSNCSPKTRRTFAPASFTPSPAWSSVAFTAPSTLTAARAAPKRDAHSPQAGFLRPGAKRR